MLLAAVVAVLAVAVGLLGAIGAFASGGAPGAESKHSVEITRHEAVLEAKVFPHGSETECQFEYGTTKGSLSQTAKCLFKPGSRNIGVPEFANLSGLEESKTYYWRIHASNEHGTVNGEEKSFTTLPTAPHANTEPAEDVKHTQATLNGFVTPNDSEITQCYFEWGTNKESLTEVANCAQTVPTGGEPSEPVFVSANIGGLAESTTYYYRLVAKNADGEDVGGRMNFRDASRPHRTPTSKARNSSNAPRLHCGASPGRTAPKSRPVSSNTASRRTSPRWFPAKRSVSSAGKPGKKSRRPLKASRKAPNTRSAWS